MKALTLEKIVSGGQTGADRGALDAALHAGFPCGGWCPPGRMAEDGPIPNAYPLSEMERGGYRERTIQNVIDSDGTVIIYFGELEGGTKQTLLHCVRREKPYKLIDGDEIDAERAAYLVAEFVRANAIATLNVAGPRGSKEPYGHAYTFALVSHLLTHPARVVPGPGEASDRGGETRERAAETRRPSRVAGGSTGTVTEHDLPRKPYKLVGRIR